LILKLQDWLSVCTGTGVASVAPCGLRGNLAPPALLVTAHTCDCSHELVLHMVPAAFTCWCFTLLRGSDEGPGCSTHGTIPIGDRGVVSVAVLPLPEASAWLPRVSFEISVEVAKTP
jgi:hypothetical protein